MKVAISNGNTHKDTAESLIVQQNPSSINDGKTLSTTKQYKLARMVVAYL